MRIIVAGMQGLKTERTLTNVQEAVSKFADHIQIEWKEYPFSPPVHGAIHTPSVLINSKVKVSGRIPSLYEIGQWIADELEHEVAA